MSGQLSQAVLGLFTASFYAVFMGIYDPPLFGVAVLVAAANTGFLKLGGRARKDLSTRVSHSMSGMSGSVAGGIALIESVKASGSEDDLFGKWVGKLSDLVEARQRFNLVGIGLAAGPRLFLSSVSVAAVLGVGALQVMDGTISLGTLIAFQALDGRLPRARVAARRARRHDPVDGGQPEPGRRHPQYAGGTGARGATSGGGCIARPMVISLLRGELELRGVTSRLQPPRPAIDRGPEPPSAARPASCARRGERERQIDGVTARVGAVYELWDGEILID